MMSIYLNINVRTQTFENIILNKINNYEIKKGFHDLYVPGLPHGIVTDQLPVIK